VSAPTATRTKPGEAEFKHWVHILLSAMWGIGLVIGMVLHLIVIFTLPVDVANAVGTAMSLVLTALFIMATVVVARRARARWEQRSLSQG
jgi:Mg/Co/Ni transporter MgtE